ncbi:hypothetical protein WEI85_00695 [Actinomycetes bacterium KLBMP 9797]
MTVRFDLHAVLELAEHAVTAPSHLYHPDRTRARGEAALTLAVSDTVYLLSAGVPGLDKAAGVPQSVFAEPDSVELDGWHTEPWQLVDPNEVYSAALRDGHQLPLVALRFLPLHRPAGHPVIDLMRAAARAGYTHITVDPADLSVAVARCRRRPRTPVGP